MSGFEAKGWSEMSELSHQIVTPKLLEIRTHFARAGSGPRSLVGSLTRFSPSPIRFDLSRCAIDAASSDSQTAELGAVGFLLYSRVRPFSRFLVRRVPREENKTLDSSHPSHFYCWPGFASVGSNGARLTGGSAFSLERDAIATQSHIYFLSNPKIFINRKLGLKCRQELRAFSPRTTMSLSFIRLWQAWRSKRTKSLLSMTLQKTIRGKK
jgi:hypothetical protein